MIEKKQLTNLRIFKILFFSFIILLASSYRLREVPHIWSKSTTYELRFEFMKNSQWWVDSSPRDDRDVLNIIFADAYHFFGNLSRIIFSLFPVLIWYIRKYARYTQITVISTENPFILSLIAYLLYYIVGELTLYIIVVRSFP